MEMKGFWNDEDGLSLGEFISIAFVIFYFFLFVVTLRHFVLYPESSKYLAELWKDFNGLMQIIISWTFGARMVKTLFKK